MTNKSLWVYPYKQESESAKALATGLGTKLIKRENSKYKDKPHKVIINWGCSEIPYPVCLNDKWAVQIVADKLKFFQVMSLAGGPRLPPWTTSRDEAQMWREDGRTVVVRNILTGHSGHGILVLTNEEQEIPEAPLYTSYVKKAAEYRVHIVRGEVIDVQQKKRNREIPDDAVNWYVRSHENGFVYCRQDVDPPKDVIEQSQKAFTLSGLDFGAVDVMWAEKSKKAYVLEINSAPGLEGETISKYVEAFRKILNG